MRGAVRIFNFVREPSAGFVRVEAFLPWRRANFQRRRRTLCKDRACRSALAVAPCESANPLRVSCVSKRSRCGAVKIFNFVGEPSAGFVRVKALSLCSLFSVGARAGAWSVLRIWLGSEDPLAVFSGWQR